MSPENKSSFLRFKDLVVLEAKKEVPRVSGEAMNILAGPLSSLFMTIPEGAVFLTKLHLTADYLLSKFIEARKKVKK